MTEPSHLPFSDINPAHIEGCVFTLENSQCSSSPLLYNCVCVHLSVKLKMSHCVLPALFPDTLWGQFTSEKDTLSVLLGLLDVESGSDSLKVGV